MTDERLEVLRQMAAATRVFEVLCDPNGHVAIDSSGMSQSAEGSPVSRVGDEFVVPFPRIPESALRATLGILARTVER